MFKNSGDVMITLILESKITRGRKLKELLSKREQCTLDICSEEKITFLSKLSVD